MIHEMMQSLHWRTLDQQRIDNKLSLMYEITHNLVAILISDFPTPLEKSSHIIPLALQADK